jgi:hypothetical protein
LRKLTRREDNALLASDRKPIRQNPPKKKKKKKKKKNNNKQTKPPQKQTRQFEELKRELSVGERELTLSLTLCVSVCVCHLCARTSCMFFLDFPGKFGII